MPGKSYANYTRNPSQQRGKRSPRKTWMDTEEDVWHMARDWRLLTHIYPRGYRCKSKLQGEVKNTLVERATVRKKKNRDHMSSQVWVLHIVGGDTDSYKQPGKHHGGHRHSNRIIAWPSHPTAEFVSRHFRFLFKGTDMGTLKRNLPPLQHPECRNSPQIHQCIQKETWHNNTVEYYTALK